MKQKIFRIKELEELGIPIIGAYESVDGMTIGKKFLQPAVINQWDSSNYNDYYTYFNENNIHFVVNIAYRLNDNVVKFEKLKKDFSNLFN